MSERLAGPNDGAGERGDREDPGDTRAEVDEPGSGTAEPTEDPTSRGGSTTSVELPAGGGFYREEELEDSNGMEVMRPDDGRLGLTGFREPEHH